MRPAWYALAGGGWREYVTLLHLPYTAWHLSYVAIGGTLAGTPSWTRLTLTLLAFFLAMGVGAHALDELNGRPLQTSIPSIVLSGLSVAALAGACAVGIAVALEYRLWLLGLVAVGAFLVPAYNLEWFRGRFHTDVWFGLAWGTFPVLTGAAAATGTIRPEIVAAAGAALALSLAQRRLSTPVRRVRRAVATVRGELELRDGSVERLTGEALVAAPEAALRAMCVAMPLLAAGVAVARI